MFAFGSVFGLNQQFEKIRFPESSHSSIYSHLANVVRKKAKSTELSSRLLSKGPKVKPGQPVMAGFQRVIAEKKNLSDKMV